MNNEIYYIVIFGVYKFFSGSASGVVAGIFIVSFIIIIAVILQPMDVIKTRQQGYFHQASLSKDISSKTVENIKWQNSAKMIYKERGVLGFWDGLVYFGAFINDD